MMIEIKTLDITNYRNIHSQHLVFDGSSKIVGDNRIGKTNTIEALYWLLTDKLLNGSKDIEQIKPLDDTKKCVTVYATFDVDGKSISIGKEYKEEWVKTRGTEEMVLKGHSTTYFYNGVKQPTKKAFDSLFNADFGLGGKEYQGIDTVQMLINPLYLGRMGDTDDWKNLRALIIDIVGDVKDDDVLLSNPHLMVLKADLDANFGRTDQVTKQYRDTIKSINEQLIGYDSTISTLEQTQEPSEDLVVAARQGIVDCDANIRSLESNVVDDKATVLIDQEILQLRKEIIELERKDYEAKNADPNVVALKEADSKKHELNDRLQSLTIDRISAMSKVSDLEHKIEHDNSLVSEMNATRLNLLDELRNLDSQLANPTFDTECPHCHRPYDADSLEEIRATVIKSLTNKKLSLITKGKDNTDRRNAILSGIQVMTSSLDDARGELARIESTISMVRNDILELDSKAAEATVSSFVPNPHIDELKHQIELKEQEKVEIRTNINKRTESVNSLIAAEIEKKESFQKVIDDYNYYLRINEQIDKVKAERSDAATKLMAFEQKLELLKEFVKSKLAMLDSHISKVFGDVSFMLIEPQVNGGYATVCKPYIRGTHTLWKSGSKSEQLTTGVVICERIKAALGLPSFPFIFDEGGEVSSNTFANRFDTKSQLICVQVKDNISTPTVMHI